MKTYRIIKYKERHEDRNSRRVRTLRYVQCPVSQDSVGWKTLKKMPGGIEAIGVYLLLVEIAAMLPIRGLLANDARPYNALNLATLTDTSVEVMERALGLLTHEEVHFIDQIDWPVDPRLISIGTHRGEVTARIIEPWTIDEDNQVIDYEGNPVTPHASDGKTSTSASLYESSGSRAGGQVTEPGDEAGPSVDADRQRAWLRWRTQVGRLFAAKGTSQHHADDTSARRLFEEHLWPEDAPGELGHARVEQALALIPEAAKRKRKMGWLTSRIKRMSSVVENPA